MSNEFISVPRELLQAMRKTCKLSIRQWDELNAAMATAPADKGQGEPVAWVVFDNGFIDDHTVVKTLADEWADRGIEVTPLYAEQPAPVAFPGYPPVPEDRKLPAPVAVVMPDRSNERDHAGDFTYEAKAWNACLD